MNKVIFIGSILLAIGIGVGAYFIVNGSITEAKDNYAKAQQNYDKLKKECDDLEKEFASKKSNFVKENHNFDEGRINIDKRLFKEICERAFTYKSEGEYNKNRKFVSNYLSEKMPFMKKVMYKNTVTKAENGVTISSFDMVGVLSKLDVIKSYYINHHGDTYRYKVFIKFIPYVKKSDLKQKSVLKRMTYIIDAETSDAEKITKFAVTECN